MLRFALLLAVALACPANSAASQTTPPQAPGSVKLQVAGSYATAVSMVVDSCGGSVVQSMPTVVAHSIGDTTLVLTHAGSRYAGTVGRDGKFQTHAGTPLVMNGFSYIVTVSGSFSLGGFDATALVDRTTVSAPAARCRYIAKWIGTRSSGTNVIPGT